MSAEIRQAILDAVNQVRTDSGRASLTDPSDDDTLTGGLGLDSLDLAVLVVTLERNLGVDPFREGNARAQTWGQLVQVYVDARNS